MHIAGVFLLFLLVGFQLLYFCPCARAAINKIKASRKLDNMGTAQFGYQQYGRLNTPNGKGIGDSFLSFDFIKKKDHIGRFHSHFEVGARYYQENEGAAFSMPEAYLKFDRSQTTMIYGRKIMNWSPQEKFWGLGAVNAQRGFNLLEQKREGLPGVHLIRRLNVLKIHLYGSYIHIPQINPGYKTENGQILGITEWAKLPPPRFRLQETEEKIVYSLEIPQVHTLVLQPSYGGELSFDHKFGHISFFSVYKPEHNPRIHAVGRYEQEPEERAFVRAKPFVNHHWVHGANTHWKAGQVTIDVGGMSINPEQGETPDFDEEFSGFSAEQSYQKEVYGYGRVALDRDGLHMSANFIKLVNNPEVGDDFFATKPKWVQAVGGMIAYSFNDKLDVFLDAKYDTKLKDKTLKAEGHYAFWKGMKVGLGVEVLEVPSSRSYWATYRSNDSVYSNLSYAF